MPEKPEKPKPETAEVDPWKVVAKVPASQGLAYLALRAVQPSNVGDDYHVEVGEVAAKTGASPSSTKSLLAALAKAGHIEAVYYLHGRHARVGYRRK